MTHVIKTKNTSDTEYLVDCKQKQLDVRCCTEKIDCTRETRLFKQSLIGFCSHGRDLIYYIEFLKQRIRNIQNSLTSKTAVQFYLVSRGLHRPNCAIFLTLHTLASTGSLVLVFSICGM